MLNQVQGTLFTLNRILHFTKWLIAITQRIKNSCQMILYVFFVENKVAKLLIREFRFSKCRFRQNAGLNKCKLKRMSNIFLFFVSTFYNSNYILYNIIIC